jgi:hypothetical protein
MTILRRLKLSRHQIDLSEAVVVDLLVRGIGSIRKN